MRWMTKELQSDSLLHSQRMMDEESLQLQSDININYDDIMATQFEPVDKIKKFRSQSFQTPMSNTPLSHFDLINNESVIQEGRQYRFSKFNRFQKTSSEIENKKVKQILEDLRSEDDQKCLQTIQFLNIEFSLLESQDYEGVSLHHFFKDILVCIKKDHALEIMVNSSNIIIHILDVAPNLISHFINMGGLDILLEKVQHFEYSEVAENAITSIFKISEDYHIYLLQNLKVIPTLIQVSDFFLLHVQKTILDIIKNMFSKINSMKVMNEKIVVYITQLQEFFLANENRHDTLCYVYQKMVEKSSKLLGQNYKEKQIFYGKIFNQEIIQTLIQISKNTIIDIYNDNKKIITLENCIKILNKVVYCKNDLNEYTLNHGIIEIIQLILELKGENIKQKSKYNSLIFEIILLINQIFTLRSQPNKLISQICQFAGIKISENTDVDQKKEILIQKPIVWYQLIKTIVEKTIDIFEQNDDNMMLRYLILLILEKLFCFLSEEDLNKLIKNNNQILGFLFRLSNSKDFMILINFLYIIDQILTKVPFILELLIREGINKKIEKLQDITKVDQLEIYNINKKTNTNIKDLKIILQNQKQNQDLQSNYFFKKIKIQQQLNELNKIIKQGSQDTEKKQQDSQPSQETNKQNQENQEDNYQLKYLNELIQNTQVFGQQIIQKFVNKEIKLDNHFQKFIDFDIDFNVNLSFKKINQYINLIIEIFNNYKEQMITSFELKQSQLIKKIVEFLTANVNQVALRISLFMTSSIQQNDILSVMIQNISYVLQNSKIITQICSVLNDKSKQQSKNIYSFSEYRFILERQKIKFTFQNNQTENIFINNQQELEYQSKQTKFQEIQSFFLQVEQFDTLNDIQNFVLNKVDLIKMKNKENQNSKIKLLRAKLQKINKLQGDLSQNSESRGNNQIESSEDDSLEDGSLMDEDSIEYSVSEIKSIRLQKKSIEMEEEKEQSDYKSDQSEEQETQLELQFSQNGTILENNMTIYDLLSRQPKGPMMYSQDDTHLKFTIMAIKEEEEKTKGSQRMIGESLAEKMRKQCQTLDTLNWQKTDRDMIQLISILDTYLRQSHLFQWELEVSAIYSPECSTLVPLMCVQQSLLTNYTVTNNKLQDLLLNKTNDPYLVLRSKQYEYVDLMTGSLQCLFNLKGRKELFQVKSMNKGKVLSSLVSKLEGSLRESHLDRHPRQNRKKIRVRRTALIHNAIYTFKHYASSQSILEFEFMDEEGSGLGPTLEFYSSVIDQLVNASGLLKRLPDGSLMPGQFTQEVQVADKTYHTTELWGMLGAMVGRAIIDQRVLDLPLSEVFWQIMRKQEMHFQQLQLIDQDVYVFVRTIQGIQNNIDMIMDGIESHQQKVNRIDALQYNNICKLDDMCITFVLPTQPEIELCPNGHNMLLTMGNLKEYLELLYDQLFNQCYQPAILAFETQLKKVIKIDNLKYFRNDEINQLFCGEINHALDFQPDSLHHYILPMHGYNRDSPQYIHFLNILQEMTPSLKSQFFKFITGCPRLPQGGLKSLSPMLTIVKKIPLKTENVDDILPSVMTCQNYIKLPEYSSLEVMKQKIYYAIKEGQHSFTLS